MKFNTIFIIFLLPFFVKAGDEKALNEKEFRDRLKVVTKECKNLTKPSKEDIKDLQNHIPPTSRAGKCMLACLMKKFDVIDKSGKLNKVEIIKLAKGISKGDEKTLKKVEKIIDKCNAEEVPEDECECSHTYIRCMISEAIREGVETLFLWDLEF